MPFFKKRSLEKEPLLKEKRFEGFFLPIEYMPPKQAYEFTVWSIHLPIGYKKYAPPPEPRLKIFLDKALRLNVPIAMFSLWKLTVKALSGYLTFYLPQELRLILHPSDWSPDKYFVEFDHIEPKDIYVQGMLTVLIENKNKLI